MYRLVLCHLRKLREMSKREYSAVVVLKETRSRRVSATVKADSDEEAMRLFQEGNFKECGGEVGGTLTSTTVADVSDFQTPEELEAEAEAEDARQARKDAWLATVDAVLPHNRLCYSTGLDPAKVAFEGTAVIRYDDAWSDGELTFQSAPVTNPTWLEIAVIADEAIVHTGDGHHIFLEGVNLDKKKTVTVDGKKYRVHQLCMGS